jgi:hypothetical protein
MANDIGVKSDIDIDWSSWIKDDQWYRASNIGIYGL